MTLTVGDTFEDPGVTATDDVDGDITANVTVAGDTVDTNTVGTYVITYNASDAAGNAATEVTRAVIVEAAPTPEDVINSEGTYNDDLFLYPTGTEDITYGPEVGIRTIDGNLTIDGDVNGEVTLRNITITGDLIVDTPNATVNNNATVEGTITIVDVSGNTWNELVSNNKLDFQAAGKTLNIGNGVTVQTLTVEAENAVVTVAEIAEVQTFTAKTSVNVTGANKIQNAVIEAAGVELDAQPESISSTEDVTIGGETKTKEQLEAAAALEAAINAVEAAEDETSKVEDQIVLAQEKYDAAVVLVGELQEENYEEGVVVELNDRLDAVHDAIRIATYKNAAVETDVHVEYGTVTHVKLADGRDTWKVDYTFDGTTGIKQAFDTGELLAVYLIDSKGNLTNQFNNMQMEFEGTTYIANALYVLQAANAGEYKYMYVVDNGDGTFNAYVLEYEITEDGKLVVDGITYEGTEEQN